MPPCEVLEKAERASWRTVTFAISCSVQESPTDPPRSPHGRRRWRRCVAIYVVAISPMLQGCTARNTPTSDHFEGSRFHNRASGTGYSLWEEIKIGWELGTKKKNWPPRFATT